jgi:hypothetical protein
MERRDKDVRIKDKAHSAGGPPATTSPRPHRRHH